MDTREEKRGAMEKEKKKKLTNTLPQINGAKHFDGKIRVDLADELDAVVC